MITTAVSVPQYLAAHCRCPILKPHITPGSEIQFWLDGRPHRIPSDRNGDPTFGGELVTTEQLSRRLGLAGVTGWDWHERLTRFVILDYDGSDHAAGHNDETLQLVIDAAKRLGWVSVRRSKGGRGVHIIVVLSEPMPAATGKQHQANAAAIVDRMCRDAGFDFRAHLDCVGVVCYVYAPADEIAEDGYKVIVEATTPAPIITATNTPTPTDHAPAQLCDQHRADIRAMQAAGYVADYADGILRCHAKGFEVLYRDSSRPGSYATTSPGRNPQSPNAFARPLDDGGWALTRYGVRPESEAQGWSANAEGFASCRIYPPDDLSVVGVARPTIEIINDEQALIDAAVASLSGSDVYQRGGSLVRIARAATPPPGAVRPPDAPRIEPLPLPTLRAVLSATAEWVKYDGRKKRKARALVPEWAVRGVASAGEWPVPTLEAIADSPFLRPDGTVATEPGYDSGTGIYLDSSCEYTPMSVERARVALLDVVCDFPFASPAHRSAWLAATLTPFARLAYHGPAPLFCIDKNAPGCGGGKLVDTTSIIATGRTAARQSAPCSEAEWRKLITSVAVCGKSFVLLDNIEGRLGGPALDAALTSDVWSDRILGASEMTTVPLSVVWFATANNVALTRDTARRTLHIRLDCRDEKPDQRTGFRHPNLLGHVRANRPMLASAALSILHGYCAAGRPDQHLPPWGSYEGWSDLVRSAVVWSGMTDPGDTRLALAESADDDSAILAQLIDAWAEADATGQGMTVAEAMQYASYDADRYAALRTVVAELDGGADRRHALGLSLRKYRGRVIGGRMFDRAERGRTKVWRVIHV